MMNLEQYRQFNDFSYKDPDRETPPFEDFATVERRIRRDRREAVAMHIKYTTRGDRGVGKTREAILDRVRIARREHTASIRREREWAKPPIRA